MPSDTEIRYILDGIYDFNPSSLTIINNETNELVKIHNTSAKCLLLLIEKHTEIVTQKQLIHYAWGEKSNTVTHNALYQCILNLRKNFVQLGCARNIITTVPRKGLMISEEILITRSGVSDSKIVTQEVSPLANKKLSRILIIMCLGLAMIITNLFRDDKNNSTDFRDLYTQVKINNRDCKYFINHDNGFEEKEPDVLLQYDNLCKDNKLLFITAYSEMKSKSVLVCDGIPGEDRNKKCMSVYLP